MFIHRHHIVPSLLIFLAIYLTPFQGFSQTTDKLIKDANTLFKAENFIEATPKYLQLLSLEPRNSLYNYRYGACLLFNQSNSGSDKKSDALKYLKFAITDPNVDPEAHYYLARAYHLNYYFDKAIRSYLTYKGLVKDKTALKRDLERQMEMCKNGQRLMSSISDIVVKERKPANYDDFFRFYNLKDIGGTILVTEEFQSKVDKKRNHRPTIHLADDANIIFFSSYGDTDDGQKDIYYRKKINASTWGESVKLPSTVNSQYDEDFPYLDPSGKYLYFSSKGHNSMGGYDIFKVSVDLESMRFGNLENLDFAISSPDDDLFYVIDQENKHAYFASARQSEGGKIHVYRVMVSKFESSAVLIAGDFLSEAPNKSKNATVQIKELATGKIIEEVKSNPANGSFSFSLPRAGQYEFIVKTENSKNPQVIPFEAPIVKENQLIKLNFIETVQGDGVAIRLSQDDYHQFTDDEKGDLLAGLFQSKSELKPNQQLAEILEQSAPTVLTNNSTNNPNANSNINQEVLIDLNLGVYEIAELSKIASRDLDKLKESLKTSENRKKQYLQYSNDQIEQAQKTEQAMNVLFIKSENEGLTEKELQKLKELDKSRIQQLKNASLGTKMVNEEIQKISEIQSDIQKADAVAQKMKSLDNNNLEPLAQLTPEEKKHIQEKFNKIDQQKPDQNVALNQVNDRLAQLSTSNTELLKVQNDLEENLALLADQKEQLSVAKKKQKPAIEANIAQTESTVESLQRQERFLVRQAEKNEREKDSLMALQNMFVETQKINPNNVSTANNIRLVEAKLKSENAKRIEQKTEDVVQTTQIIEIDSDEPTVENTTNSLAENRDEIHENIQKRAADIYEIEKKIQLLDQNDAKNKLALEQQKIALIDEQINDLNELALLEDDQTAVKREISAQETQRMISENVISELEQIAQNNPAETKSNLEDESSNTNSNEQNQSTENQNIANLSSKSSDEDETDTTSNEATNRASQVDISGEMNALRASYELNENFSELDNQSIENQNNVAQYEAALVALSKRTDLDVNSRNQVVDELNQIERWRNETNNLQVQNENEANRNGNDSTENESNENEFSQPETVKNNFSSAATVSQENSKAIGLAQDIAAKKDENYYLMQELEETDSKRKTKKILKRIEKNDEEILKNQYTLLLTEKEDYAQVTDSIERTLNKDLKNNPLIKSEMYILKTKLNETEEVLSVLENTKKSDRERIVVQALDFREDYLKQLNLTVSRIEEQNEIARISEETGIDQSWLTDQRKLDYTLANINEEIEITKERISSLKKNLSSYAKSEQPTIQKDIEELTAHLADMQAIKKDTEKKIQTRKENEARVTVNPKLENSAIDTTLLNKIPESELAALLETPDFLALRNNIVSFNMLEIRLQNAQNRQKSIKNEIQAQVNLIASSSSNQEKQKGRDNLNTLIAAYKKTEADIIAVESETNRLKIEIESSPTYRKNPVFFNTIASSTKIQERLIAIAQPSENVEINEMQTAGIVFVNPEIRSQVKDNFGLNNVQIPGMVYKIQIGAFNKPINLATFAEFDPVTTDQVGNSIRYSAGLFYNKSQAFSNLTPIKAMGYPDAFVVAYCDGVRYTIAEADELLRQGKCALNNAAENSAVIATNRIPSSVKTNYNQSSNAAPAMALEESKGLLFTVQIGVYNTPRTSALLQNLEPLNTQLTEKKQIRYSVGRFDQIQDAIKQRDEVKSKGFTDAFVVAYYNGEKITFAEAQNLINAQGDVVLFNRQQEKKVVVPNIKIELIQAQNEDSTEQVELLNAHKIKYQLVSKKTYTKAPTDIIDAYRNKNIWVYHDAQRNKLVSSVLDDKTKTSDDSFEVTPIYQGFTVLDTTQITYQNLAGYQAETNYYALTMTWRNDLPYLVAYLLQQNYEFAIAEWIPEEKKLKFSPLNYLQKEKIKKALISYGEVYFMESVITF